MTPTCEPMPAGAYHRHPALGSSAIRTKLLSNRLFHARFIAGTLPFQDTEASDLGTVAHAAILGDRPLAEVVAVIPREVLGKNDACSTNAYRAWAAEQYEDVILMKRAQYDAALRIREAVLAHPIARLYFEADGPVERPYLWRDAETGHFCKSKVDKQPANMPLLVDLKTTWNVNEYQFRKRLEHDFYSVQDAHYSAGREQETGEPQQFVWVVAPNKPPYQPVRIYGLGAEKREAARRQRLFALTDLAERSESGDWSDVGENEIVML